MPQFLDSVAEEGSLALLRPLFVVVCYFLSAAGSLQVYVASHWRHNWGKVRLWCEPALSTPGTGIGVPNEGV